MPDYYTQTSFVIPCASETEQNWLLRMVAKAKLWSDGDISAAAEDNGIAIYGICCLEELVALIQKFLLRFHPDKMFGFTWAETCSRPVVDAFSGGAVVIGPYTEKWMVTRQFVSRNIPVGKDLGWKP